MNLEIILKDRTYMKATATSLRFDAEIAHNGHGASERVIVKLFNIDQPTATVFADRIDRIDIKPDYNGPG